MAQRERWEFHYQPSDLAEAARKKRDHHNNRAEWWNSQKENVLQEVRETGIQVSESPAASYGSTTSGYGPQVMIRTDLQKKLTECHEKIEKHKSKAAEYDGWVQVLEKSSHSHLVLHADDYLYFFGRQNFGNE